MGLLNIAILLLAFFYFIYSWFNSYGWDGFGIFFFTIMYITFPYLVQKRKKARGESNINLKNKSDISSDKLFLVSFVYFFVYLFLIGELEFMPAVGITSIVILLSMLIIYLVMVVLYFLNQPMQRPFYNGFRVSIILFIVFVLMILFYFDNSLIYINKG